VYAAVRNAVSAVSNAATVRWCIAGAALAVYLIVIPAVFHASPYILTILTTASALAFISAGVWLTFHIGRINIGQGAFALIGGYAGALAVVDLGLPFWFAVPLGGIAALAVGVVIGLPILRLRGVYFAMVTLSLSETARLAALSFSGLTGGAKGVVNIPLPGGLSLFGFTLLGDFADINKHLAFYYLGALLLVAGFAAMFRIVHSRLGWLFRSLQQNEDLAASVGVNVAQLRLVAFAISCFLGGAGGAFIASMQQSIYPASFQVQDSIYFMLYCFLGGLGYVFGPLVGTFVLFLSFEFLAGLNEYQPLIYAVIMIALMLGLPNGLLSLRLPRFATWRAWFGLRAEKDDGAA